MNLYGRMLSGVPVSTQWGPQGYFYPTQIAQYALSHYSKFLKVGDYGGEPLVIEDAEDESTTRWTSKGSSRVRIVVDQSTMSRVVEFQASGKLVSSKRYCATLLCNGVNSTRAGES